MTLHYPFPLFDYFEHVAFLERCLRSLLLLPLIVVVVVIGDIHADVVVVAVAVAVAAAVEGASLEVQLQYPDYENKVPIDQYLNDELFAED